jgi:hypothetical protein
MGQRPPVLLEEDNPRDRYSQVNRLIFRDRWQFVGWVAFPPNET